MGNLVAMRYATPLFAWLADHTYVRCSTDGKSWGCWGGKSGGAPLRSGTGSTRRADLIAEPDERAGITCYLVNGVCHQAANRILYPCELTVRGARGYDVSEILFGTYGRPRALAGLCNAPFDRHEGVTGDLRECLAGPAESSFQPPPPPPGPFRSRERAYLGRVDELYREAGPGMLREGPEGFERLADFARRLFDVKIDYHLGEDLDLGVRRRLQELRHEVEAKRAPLEEAFGREAMPALEFSSLLEQAFTRFQESTANILPSAQFRGLLGTDPGDVVLMADPTIVARAYPGR